MMLTFDANKHNKRLAASCMAYVSNTYHLAVMAKIHNVVVLCNNFWGCKPKGINR